MKGLAFAILTIGTAMVNACAHYGYCRCGNLDDTKTKDVCGKLQAEGSASLHTFEDGHSYCHFKYLTYVRPLHVIAVTEHWPNGAPHEKRPVEQVMNPLGARDSPHPEIAELPTEETSRDTRPSTTEHRNPALGVPRFMRETAATMNRSRMDESHENSAPEPPENLAQYESLRSRTIKSLTTYLYTIVMEPSTPTSPSPSNIIRLDLTSLTPSPIPTSSPTPILSPTPIQYHESPDEFVQGGITYVKRAIIARKDFRQGTSHIWKYGLQYIRDSDKKEVYYCHECRVGKSKQELFVINGTSRIRNHLEQKHQIDPQSGIKRKGSVRKSIIDQQKDGAASSIFFWKESVEKFKELLIRWIVYCHIAFFQLENQYFRELLLFLNPALLNHLPKAAKTIRSWVMNAFISKKQQLREDLHHSRSRISISFDLWTSPNPYAILGVVAMWIDTTGMRRVTALGMRRIYGEHTGENLGSVVLELLEEYDISAQPVTISGDQIGYFMLDNASANDTAVEFILKDLCPWMKSKQRRHRRLRCLGHVINLCCQAFLMGRNCEKYLAKLEKHHQRGDYTKVEELWKKFGCLGRLHNLEFATIIIGGDLSQFDGLELIQNNSTRWNSWFYSITRALNVRERLELFSARHVPGKGSVGIANFKLDGQHWFELEKIELALKDFYAATLLSEGKKTSLADWFSTLDCLLREISETKDHYHDIHTEDDNNFTWKYLQGCADAAWLKCVEYYNNQQLNWQNRFPEDTDLPPTYYAAQILDPYRKWGWFRQEWVLHGDEEKKRWFENAQLAVKHLWETEYKGRYPVEMLPPPARKERDPDPAFDRQREHKRIRIDAPVSTTDLYEQYISTDRLHNEEAGCNEAIAYWLSRYDSQRDLARFALDMFAISPMSDECERLFSSAKLTIVDRRGRLKADIIEACECLRAWYGKPQAEGNSDIEDSENEDD
ncbi:Dimer-Tnp-hAT domain containing protein [Pyrenophora tritici-repentis]|uniref:Dimer-Tnp-hAT domain containing protein n=1 Tax=Pyrenophora tritici-repentis TaxID=45151 RepID=A0A834RRH4_9PLEO|nr:Dimer-Tnp-hAT domain containing protein [Pyrenophora tritici-repentis]